MTGKYDDILYLPHHVSPTRRRMTMAERAAQFSPFAALTGHDDAIRETGRVTERRIELSEDEKAGLDQRQQLLLSALERGEHPKVTVTYFRPDKKKVGGEYLTFTGEVKKVEETEKVLIFTEGEKIPLNEVLALDGEIFRHDFDN